MGTEIYKKLMDVQAALHAPKNQHNSFGNYNYRSAEDIVEAAKPLFKSAGLLLNLSDEVALIGERYYIKATARAIDVETGASVETSALAREASEKKGMDASQVTGTASSYARKYALNGLLAIDDTRDADTDEYRGGRPEPKRRAQVKRQQERHEEVPPKEEIKEARNALMVAMAQEKCSPDEARKICRKHFRKDSAANLNIEELRAMTNNLNDWHSELIAEG